LAIPEIGRDRENSQLGTGFAFPLRLNVQGGFKLSSGIQNIEEAIRIILRTSVGERVYRPNFGSRLAELTFAPMNSDTLMRLRLHVREALELWEPRIDLDEVSTDPDPIRGRVDIQIVYRIRENYDRHNLVFPFYLTPEAE
jgi:uncharacterized protein